MEYYRATPRLYQGSKTVAKVRIFSFFWINRRKFFISIFCWYPWKPVQSVKIRNLFILLLPFPPTVSRARRRSAGRSASVRRGAGVCPPLWTWSWRNGSSRWTGRCCRRIAFRYGRNSPLTAFHNLYRVPFFSRPSVHKDRLYSFVFHILLMLKLKCKGKKIWIGSPKICFSVTVIIEWWLIRSLFKKIIFLPIYRVIPYIGLYFYQGRMITNNNVIETWLPWKIVSQSVCVPRNRGFIWSDNGW